MFKWIKKLFCKKEDPITMNLQAFISQALVQICDGIIDAQAKTSGTKITENEKRHFQAYICPTPINTSGPSPRDNFYQIDFDLSVTIKKDSNTDHKVGISVVDDTSINFSQTMNQGKSNTIVSRMKFTIPIIYPTVPNQKY